MLSKSDRLLIRAYLGYSPVKNIVENADVKKFSDAPLVVKKLIFDDENDDLNEMLDLEEMRNKDHRELNTLLHTSDETFKQMVTEAKNFSTSQQCSILKAFVVSFCFFLYRRITTLNCAA